MSLLKKLDRRFGDSTLWQFIKFNLVSFCSWPSRISCPWSLTGSARPSRPS